MQGLFSCLNKVCPVTLEVDVLHVQDPLAITQNAGDRPQDWRPEDTELVLCHTYKLRLCESGVCVMPLKHLLLLFMRQVSNLFWARGIVVARQRRVKKCYKCNYSGMSC